MKKILILLFLIITNVQTANYFIDSLTSGCTFAILPKNRYLADNPPACTSGSFTIYNGGTSTASLTGYFYNLNNLYGYVPSYHGTIILDGSDGYMTIGSSLGDLTNKRITISTFINQYTISATAYLFNWQVDATHRITLSSYNSNFYVGVCNGAQVSRFFYYSGIVTNNTRWCLQVVINLNGATNADKIKCYVNGVAPTMYESGTIPSTLPTLSTATASLGYNTYSWNGRIENFLWFNDTITKTKLDSLRLMSDSLNNAKLYTNGTLLEKSNCTHQTDIDFTCRDSVVRKIDISYPNDTLKHTLLFVGHGFVGQKWDVTEAWRDRLCDMGFIVAAITTRKDAGGLEIYDFYDAVKYVESNYSSRLNGRKAYVGYSGGGGNGYSIFTKMPDLFDFVIPYFGMVDYENFYNYSVPNAPACSTYIGGTPSQVPNNYLARNSISAIENTNGKGKIIILHDMYDNSVNVWNADIWKSVSDELGYTNYTYKRSDGTDYWKVLHGYPIYGNTAEYINQFERNIFPRWVDTVLTANLPNKTINSVDTFTVPAFVRTKNFAVILGNSHRGKVIYDTSSTKLTIINNDTKTTITNGISIWSGFNPGSLYNVTTNNNGNVIDRAYTANGSGDIQVYFNLDSAETLTVQYSTEIATPPAFINQPENDTTNGLATFSVTYTGSNVVVDWYVNNQWRANGSNLSYTGRHLDSIQAILRNNVDTIYSNKVKLYFVHANVDSVKDSTDVYMSGWFVDGENWDGSINSNIEITNISHSDTAIIFRSNTKLNTFKTKYQILISNGTYSINRYFGNLRKGIAFFCFGK